MFQQFKLVSGTWDVRGIDGKLERVKPSAIKHTAFLSVEGELDDISGQGQTNAAHALCTGIDPAMQQHFEVPGAGHYGIFSGRRWRELVYPQVRDFIQQYDEPFPASAAAKAAAAGNPIDDSGTLPRSQSAAEELIVKKVAKSKPQKKSAGAKAVNGSGAASKVASTVN